MNEGVRYDPMKCPGQDDMHPVPTSENLFWSTVESAVSAHLGKAWRLEECRAVGGGDISQAHILEGRGLRLFLKRRAGGTALFAAEADGLAALASTCTIRVPEVLVQGAVGEEAFLVLEYLVLEHSGAASDGQLGEGLAALHREGGKAFGWGRDNFIGATPQPNGWGDDWVAFYRERRLVHLLRLCGDHGLRATGERLAEALPAFFAGHRPRPSLLHGDLWGGNRGALPDGTPVLFDPAVYFGDREADIAMTELFGGFRADFQAAYNAAWPLDPGYRVRRDLYNLYHVLNHYHLFGGGYGNQAQRMMERLLAEAGQG